VRTPQQRVGRLLSGTRQGISLPALLVHGQLGCALAQGGHAASSAQWFFPVAVAFSSSSVTTGSAQLQHASARNVAAHLAMARNLEASLGPQSASPLSCTWLQS